MCEAYAVRVSALPSGHRTGLYNPCRPDTGSITHAMPYSKPMKMITHWLTPEEKATTSRSGATRTSPFPHALREGLKLYFEDAKDWIDDRGGDEGAERPA